MIPARFYLTGTDTDVGKTVTAAALCRAFDLTYWKPVQAGEPTDTDTVRALAGVETFPEAFRLGTPSSPHTSARDAGVRITLEAIRLPTAGRLLVEGAGGWMVPYRADPLLWQADVVRHLGLPVVVVARSGLGTLNHTLLTLRAIEADDIDCAGIVLVGPPHADNEADLTRLGGVPVLARLPRIDLARGIGPLVERLGG